MQFVTVRDFRNASGSVWEKLNQEGELVVTNNGKPAAILVDVKDSDVEQALRDIRRAKLLRLLTEAREEAALRGFMSDEEIEAEIKAARAEFKKKHSRSL